MTFFCICGEKREDHEDNSKWASQVKDCEKSGCLSYKTDWTQRKIHSYDYLFFSGMCVITISIVMMIFTHELLFFLPIGLAFIEFFVWHKELVKERKGLNYITEKKL